MKMIMIGCDNPTCGRTGVPEDDGKGDLPPYGWVTAQGGWFGSGPSYDVVVHDIDCLVPAIEYQAAEEREGLR